MEILWLRLPTTWETVKSHSVRKAGNYWLWGRRQGPTSGLHMTCPPNTFAYAPGCIHKSVGCIYTWICMYIDEERCKCCIFFHLNISGSISHSDLQFFLFFDLKMLLSNISLLLLVYCIVWVQVFYWFSSSLLIKEVVNSLFFCYFLIRFWSQKKM